MVGPYMPRQAHTIAPWTFGGQRVKPYVITAAGRVPDPARLAGARDHAASMLAAEAPDDALGFVILHLGEDADWLLCDWWVNGDSLAQRLSSGDVQGGPFAPRAPSPLVACVWELALIDHERRAWIAAMMSKDGEGPTAYLSDAYKDETC
ncbi:MAG: hypothetical protein DI498_04735 [Paracoccus denitrificans]|nr:MAG: hypothetical protein DI498_04735 [Paracoccus denitrificans]PZO85238.1 MAG: hypothetical protein DI633_04735 [Paracoccus denitrificans]